MRCYDRENRFPGDVRDKNTKMKTEGYVDLEKFHDWRSTLKKSIARKKMMQHRTMLDSAKKVEDLEITQESRDLHKMMEFTRDMYK